MRVLGFGQSNQGWKPVLLLVGCLVVIVNVGGALRGLWLAQVLSVGAAVAGVAAAAVVVGAITRRLFIEGLYWAFLLVGVFGMQLAPLVGERVAGGAPVLRALLTPCGMGVALGIAFVLAPAITRRDDRRHAP